MTLLTPAQLAEKYPVSKSLIYAACIGGLLTHFRVPATKGARGKYLIDEADFLAWLESNKHEAGDAPPPTPATPLSRHLKL